MSVSLHKSEAYYLDRALRTPAVGPEPIPPAYGPGYPRARRILASAVLAGLAMGGSVAMADGASAGEATAKPCRNDSAYWKGSRPGVDAVQRMSKPIPAGYRPALMGDITRWTPVKGYACDAALRAIYNANHAR